MRKLVLMGTAAALVAFAGVAQAQDQVTGNVDLTSDYLFRGITQANHKPAIQGGLDYSSKIGVYAGLWGSNVNFGPADGTSQELDTYAGYSASAGPIGYDVGVIYYNYPGGTNSDNFYEVYGKVSYQGLTLGNAWSHDYFGGTGTSNYLSADYDIPVSLPAGLSVSVPAGHQWIANNVLWGTPDYTDYGLSVSKDFAGLTWKVAYSDTNLSKSQCFGGSNACEGEAVLSVGKNF